MISALRSLCGLIVLLAAAMPAPAQVRPDVLPLDELRPGMIGTVKTVLSGTTIEEFEVELVSVVRKIGPDQDMILARGRGERIAHLGVAQGMSGSPVYVDGKLIGALSSTWSFVKDPLMGITPALQMERESGSAGGGGGGAPRSRRGDLGAVEFLRRNAPRVGDHGFTPIAAPLVISGLDRRLLPVAAELFEPWGFRVTEGGAGGEAQGGAIEPGATLGVRIAGGDANLTAIGTATWVDGDVVHGWGHPMFQLGDVEMPLVSGYIHSVIPNQAISFKLGSGGDVVGTLTSDRRSGIAGRLGDGPPLTRFELTVRRGDASESFGYDVVRHATLTPAVVGVLAANSVLAQGGAAGEETVRFVQELVLTDGRRTTVETTFSGDQTLGQIVQLLSQAVDVILSNPFEEVELERIDAVLDYEAGTRMSVLMELSLDDDTHAPGDVVRGSYVLRDWRGEETSHRFALPLPADAREARYLLLAADSGTAEQYEAERAPRLYAPRTLDEFLDRIRRLKQTDEVHLHLYRQSEGVLLDGRPLPDLPPSALSVLRGASRSGPQAELPAELVAQQRDEAGSFVQGAHTILFEVRKENP